MPQLPKARALTTEENDKLTRKRLSALFHRHIQYVTGLWKEKAIGDHEAVAMLRALADSEPYCSLGLVVRHQEDLKADTFSFTVSFPD